VRRAWTCWPVRASGDWRAFKGCNLTSCLSISPTRVIPSTVLQQLGKRSSGCAQIRWSVSKQTSGELTGVGECHRFRLLRRTVRHLQTAIRTSIRLGITATVRHVVGACLCEDKPPRHRTVAGTGLLLFAPFELSAVAPLLSRWFDGVTPASSHPHRLPSESPGMAADLQFVLQIILIDVTTFLAHRWRGRSIHSRAV
jgi:hypothetical protein